MKRINVRLSHVGLAVGAIGLFVGCGSDQQFNAMPSALSSASERANAPAIPRVQGQTSQGSTVAPTPVRLVVTPPPTATPRPIATPIPTATPRPVATTPMPVAPAPAPAPTQTAPVAMPSTGSCMDDVAQLGWQSLASREDVQVHLRPSGGPDFEALGYPERVLSSTSVQIMFENPYRPGSSLYFRNTIDYSRDGYRIEIVDQATNARATLTASEMDTNTFIVGIAGNPVSATVAATAPDATGNLPRNSSFVWFNTSRAFYSRIQTFGASSIALYCNNVLIAKGQQDVASLDRGMRNGMKRVVQYAPGKWGYGFDETTPSLYASVDCPLEIAAGATGSCSVSDSSRSLLGGTWYVDGMAVKTFEGSFDQLALVNQGTGARKIHAVVRYKDGTQERRDIKLVKFK